MNRFLALALSLFVLGSSHAQTCVDPSAPEFLLSSGTIPSFSDCSPLVLEEAILACNIGNGLIRVNTNLSSTKNLIFDITAPGDSCATRFVNQLLLDGVNGGLFYTDCANGVCGVVPWVLEGGVDYGDPFVLVGSVFSILGAEGLTGTWKVEVSVFGIDDIPSANLTISFIEGECDSCGGCTDVYACNYSPNAITDNGSCLYPIQFYTCSGDCENDVDGDGICDELEVAGCMDPIACNFNPSATDDDGSCLLNDNCGVCGGDNSSCTGCTDQSACNYNPEVSFDDGSCEYESCSGCGQELFFAIDALAGGESAGLADGTGLFPGNGVVDSISISLDFLNVSGDGSWASDMMLFIYPRTILVTSLGDTICPLTVSTWEIGRPIGPTSNQETTQRPFH